MVYRFVIISAEDESFLREFELDGNNTLMDFHYAIQEELEFDMSQIATFFTVTSEWEKEEEFTIFDMGTNTTVMGDVLIEDVIIEKNQKLLYVFDQFNERALFIEMVGKREYIEGREYPVCTKSQGKPPIQIVFKTSSYIDPYDMQGIDYDSDPGMDDDITMLGLESIEDIEDL